MVLIRDYGQSRRFARRMAKAAVLTMASIMGVEAQDSTEDGLSVEAVLSILDARDESTPGFEGSDDEETLFSDGPREPAVLSAEGSLIGKGARTLKPRSEGDAVAALVAALGAGPNAPDSGTGGEAVEGAEPEVEEPGVQSPSLLEKLGGFIGLGGD